MCLRHPALVVLRAMRNVIVRIALDISPKASFLQILVFEHPICLDFVLFYSVTNPNLNNMVGLRHFPDCRTGYIAQ